MLNYNLCFKIIFDGIYSRLSYQEVLNKLSQCLGASVILYDAGGRVLASILTKDAPRFLSENLTYDVLSYLWGKENFHNRSSYVSRDGLFYQTKAVMKDREILAYQMCAFKSPEDRVHYQEVLEALEPLAEPGKIMYDSFRWSQCGPVVLAARDVLEGTVSSYDQYEDDFPGSYRIMYFAYKDEDHKALRRIFDTLALEFKVLPYFYKGKGAFLICDIHDSKRLDHVILKLEGKVRLFISDDMNHLEDCREKMEFLEKMSVLPENKTLDSKVYEQDWKFKLYFREIAPMFKSAGIVNYSVEKLREEDESKNTELYVTLRAYLFNNNNIGKTAEVLHIHRNTLVYRLQKIQSFFKEDINNIRASRQIFTYMLLSETYINCDKKD